MSTSDVVAGVVDFLAASVAEEAVERGLKILGPALTSLRLELPPEVVDGVIAEVKKALRELARYVIDLLFVQGKLTVSTSGAIIVRVHDGAHPDDA